MKKLSDTVYFDPATSDGDFTAEVWSPKGLFARVHGNLGAPEPRVSGDEKLTCNAAIVQSLWSAATEHAQSLAADAVASAMEDAAEESDAETTVDNLPDELTDSDEETSRTASEIADDHRAAAEELAKQSQTIAGYAESLGEESTTGWCSNCVEHGTHHQIDNAGGVRSSYLCHNCGTPTVHCTAPGCANLAVKPTGLKSLVPYCAEHRHDIPSFERAGEQIDDLEQWKTAVEFAKPNLARATNRATMGVGAVGLFAGGAWLAAPAIGGFVGAQFLGFTGAVATNAGLATLGGGAVAAGGLGMAGGTYVVAATGGLLGGVYGDRILGSYIGDDSSFNIEKIRDGDGVPVVIARGFMNETNGDWHTAVRAATRRYPDSPVYLLNWGSKELKNLAGIAGAMGLGHVGKKGLLAVVGRASKKAAAKIAPVAPVLAGGALLSNPWHTAVNRANQTGAALAALLTKSKQEEFVLMGHSLGGRVMVTAAAAMAGFGSTPKIRDVHLMGAAIGTKRSWRPVSEAVSGTVHNCHSVNDPILHYLYRSAQLGQVAAGHSGIGSDYPNIVDHDVSSQVKSHSAYYDEVPLRS
ncbi:DUF726 domain-containing protein [Corynebacterium sp. AOP40-9SA-29]|uniref:DUF726 domain-containing protein n=1 Tax=Corynebacterium sp. AOP40-9SA-29 TaxID=3457677 RepID=UPI0040335696